MKGTKVFKIVLALGLLLALVAGIALAQGPGPRAGLAPQDAVGTTFTYQGRLTDGGSPATGDYDFEFKLYDAAEDGTQVGSTIPIDDYTIAGEGLFTVQLDFGEGAFEGSGRWLEIGVRPGSETGAYTTLLPRQELTPSPYALALPGLWTQQNTTSPNLIGGYSGNDVTGGVVGATIGGGGQSSAVNHVTGNYGTVGGGRGNDATASGTTVAGGDNNEASDEYATVGGGDTNEASNSAATVAGGELNVASGSQAAIAGGQENTASGAAAAVGGGSSNQASADYVTVGGGNSNQATASYATVGGGEGNTADAAHATIAGGEGNEANDNWATIGGGKENIASGTAATAGGGSGNQVTASYATIGGGMSNIVTATATYATIGGGYNNDASDQYATASGGGLNEATGFASAIGGGYSNEARGYIATASGGTGNKANGNYAAIGGGFGNVVSGTYATVPGGFQASASLYGQMAYASGKFASAGDAQASLYVVRNTTNDDTPTELFLDGVDDRINVAPGRTMTFDILVVGRSDSGDSAGYEVHGVIENVGGTTSFVGGDPAVVTLGEDVIAWDAEAVAYNGPDALSVMVTGVDGTNIHWVATVRTVEVAW
jgi:hypothetical protein